MSKMSKSYQLMHQLTESEKHILETFLQTSHSFVSCTLYNHQFDSLVYGQGKPELLCASPIFRRLAILKWL